MELGILGPLTVRVGGANLAPSAPKQRKVLAALLVHADQVVPVPSLIRELWDDEPPVSGLTTLQTYVLNLRRMFSECTGLSAAQISRELIITRSGGYMFRTSRAQLDVHEYHTKMAAGRAALSVGDDIAGIAKLTGALRMWRGPALVDVPVGRVLESQRLQLEESRLVILEYLLDAQLRRGMYREVLSELAALTAENPLHEGLQGQYMRALYLSGRRAHALEVFRRLRESLVVELGLEPGRSVQELHRAILNGASDLETHLQIERPQGDFVRTPVWGGAQPHS
jgi:DNA-binding SARP family transcriptional activator